MIWRSARTQRWAIAHWQLLAHGLTIEAIKHRIREGRLHPIHRGVYAVGRKELDREGGWIAALLACGWKHPDGPEPIALSHTSAAVLLGIRARDSGPVDISLDAAVVRRRPTIRVHRRRLGPGDITTRAGIPTTGPVLTLIDLATTVPDRQVETAINEADRLDLISPPALLAALDAQPRRPGVGRLRAILIRHSLELPTSELERLFLPLAARAGLPTPLTQQWINGYRVDLYLPTLGLVVEADSLRYHRTPSRQTVDARRDQAHAAAGLERLRFTHFQIRYEPRYVEAVLRRVAEQRLAILDG